ncbi:MAG: TlpA family protein disulfide reductase [Chitinophagales bacterium]
MIQKSSSLFAVIVFALTSLVIDPHAVSQTIPPFQMMLSGNKIFKASDLPKGKPVVLIYFDPDCDHCQKLMDELFKKINDFKKAEIVMVTYKPLDELPPFEKKHNTPKYSNIKVGTEGTGFYLRNYYGLMKMPFTALYDKKGNLSYSYKEQTPVDDLIKHLKNLK